MLIKSVRGFTPAWGEDCFIAENATLIGDVVMGDQCSIWYQAVVRGDVHHIRIGDRVNIQDGAVLIKGKRIVSKSFKIGTVRMINNIVSESVWEEIKQWIKNNTKNYSKLALLGSGGNINKLFKIAKVKEGRPLSMIKLNQLYNELNQLDYNERIVQWELNPDRSDVIIPATQIYLKALHWSGASEIFVPKIGLTDGIIKVLFNEND